jgi:glycosyltransferase involved in cell wall biosynthesis
MLNASIKEKTLVWVSHSSGLYGAERSLLSAALGVAQGGHSHPVMVIPDDGPLVDECRRLGLETIICSYDYWAKPAWRIWGVVSRIRINLWAAFTLYRRLRNRGVVVVCTNTIVTPVGAILARLLRVPHIWHIREFVREDFGWCFDYGERAAMRLVSSLSTYVICNSEAVAQKFRRLLRGVPIDVVYNGFNFSAAPCEDPVSKYRKCVKEAPRGPILLMLGSVNEHKGQYEAVQALSILKARGFLGRLMIVGGQEQYYRQQLDGLARDLGVAECVDYSEFSSEPRQLIKDAALTLMCSRSEAFGRSAVESISEGTPVVAADSGGLPEVVVDGQSGLLYRSGDPADLAAKIEALLSDEMKYGFLAAKGYQFVRDRFGMERYVQAYTSIIDELVSKNYA